MPALKHSVDRFVAILNHLVERPHAEMRATARDFKISPVSLYNWSAKSARDEQADLKEKSEFYFEWMGQSSYFHRHLVLCRRISILQIDSRLRSAAVNNHRELLFRQGSLRTRACSAYRVNGVMESVVHGYVRRDLLLTRSK